MTKDMVRSTVIFIVGLLIAINGAASYGFDWSKVTFYAGLTTMIGVSLMVISTIFFFIFRKRKSPQKKQGRM